MKRPRQRARTSLAVAPLFAIMMAGAACFDDVTLGQGSVPHAGSSGNESSAVGGSGGQGGAAAGGTSGTGQSGAAGCCAELEDGRAGARCEEDDDGRCDGGSGGRAP